MKHLIIAVIMALCTLATTAQNGGQYPENDNIRLEWLGKVGANYFERIANKKSCAVTVKIEYNHTFTEVIIPAHGNYDLNLGPTLLSGVRAKTIQVNCGAPDNGWIEFSLTAMPMRFVSSNATYDKVKDEVLVTFTVADVTKIDRIIVELSVDGGKTYKQLGLVWPENIQGNKTYNVRISAAAIRAIK